MIDSVRSKLTAFVSTLAVMAAIAAAPASASAAIQLGAFTPGAPANAQALSEYAQMVGRQPDIVMWYRDFGQPLLYPNEVANLRATGQAPMETWEPNEQSLADIPSGAYDSYLRESAVLAKNWGSTLLIRFGQEMNGDWTAWGSSAISPATFIAAWRHVVSIFRASGATNVKWVWSPNVQEGSKYPISPYFPGDSWIDYVGLDGYNWGTKGERWQSLSEVFGVSYEIVTHLSSQPVIIAETSSSETGGDKAEWIRNAFLSEIPRNFPRVTAVVWFNQVKEDDWRINSSQGALEAYRSVVSCSIYGGAKQCTTTPGPGETSEGANEAPTPKEKGKKKKLTVHLLRVPRRVSDEAAGSVSYEVSQAAQVQIQVFARGHAGPRVKLTQRSRQGHSRLPLARILRRHRLKIGKYRIVMRARSADGQRSRPHGASFRIV